MRGLVVVTVVLLAGCTADSPAEEAELDIGEWFEISGSTASDSGDVAEFVERVERLPDTLHPAFGPELVQHVQTRHQNEALPNVPSRVTDSFGGETVSLSSQANLAPDGHVVSWNNFTKVDCPAVTRWKDRGVRETSCSYDWTFEMPGATRRANHFEFRYQSTWEAQEWIETPAGSFLTQRFGLAVDGVPTGQVLLARTACGDLSIQQRLEAAAGNPATSSALSSLHCA